MNEEIRDKIAKLAVNASLQFAPAMIAGEEIPFEISRQFNVLAANAVFNAQESDDQLVAIFREIQALMEIAYFVGQENGNILHYKVSAN